MAQRTAKQTLREFELIRAITRRFARKSAGLVQGIGDDAAVVAATPKTWWHLTTDLLAEGVHFDLNTALPESVGYKAAVANLSDIAAMGAVPRYLLISLAVPQSLKPAQIYRLYEGLMKACRPHGVTLIGGDTSSSKAGLFLSITLVGTTATNRALFRHGALAGDLIYVTGTLGDSFAGLQLLSQNKKTGLAGEKPLPLSQSHRSFLLNRHLRPTARLAEGQWLNTARLATSAIDLSDGLSGDLRHICEESGVGAELNLGTLPISPACRAYAESSRLEPAQMALAGGEDYELLFTVSAKNQSRLERQARAQSYRITCIGRIRPRRFGVHMTSGDGTMTPIPVTSYEHFH